MNINFYAIKNVASTDWLAFAPKAAKAALACAALAACAACSAPGSGRALGSGVFYRCEFGIEFSVRFVDDSAVLDSSRGFDVLYRPAGSSARSYHNARMDAQFGLGAGGREALLKYPLLPLAARCTQD